jgi:ACR3 family arsenite efflux pump ArsB
LKWFEQQLAIGAVTASAGLLVIVPLLISKWTRRWAQRTLDGVSRPSEP